jgi:hypothetical protein
MAAVTPRKNIRPTTRQFGINDMLAMALSPVARVIERVYLRRSLLWSGRMVQMLQAQIQNDQRVIAGEQKRQAEITSRLNDLQ